MFRFASCLGATALMLLAGCSSDDDGTPSPIEPSPVTSVDDAAPAAPASSSSTSVAPMSPATTAAPQVPRVVTVEVQMPDLDLDTVVSAGTEASGDPFGETFSTCSAFRSVVGAYAVGVGGPDAELPWVSIVSAARIDGAGEVAADVRIDLPDGGAVDAVGTLELDADLASGSFTATAPDGALVTGTFECTGGDRPPVTMSATEAGAIEVVALLDNDGRERVVTAATLDAVEADCPAANGGETLVVRVDGDASLGAISSFEIDQAAGGTTMRLRVGGATYEFDDVVLDLDDDARAGTFVAEGAVAVAGAFSCT